MTKGQSDKKYLAIELILEDGMSISAAAEMIGETPEIVEKWLADCQAEYEEKLRAQEADLIEKKKQLTELQDEIRLRRALYDLIIDHPDRGAEMNARKHWENIPEKAKHRIITNAHCIDCGATIITDYVMQGDDEGIILYGKCCKCGKSMATSVGVYD
jgi:transposase-like protein